MDVLTCATLGVISSHHNSHRPPRSYKFFIGHLRVMMSWSAYSSSLLGLNFCFETSLFWGVVIFFSPLELCLPHGKLHHSHTFAQFGAGTVHDTCSVPFSSATLLGIRAAQLLNVLAVTDMIFLSLCLPLLLLGYQFVVFQGFAILQYSFTSSKTSGRKESQAFVNSRN